MINELIEKEIEKYRGCAFDGGACLNCGISQEGLIREVGQTIAKEVAMLFKEKNYGSYYINKDKIELFADQIINEVSK